MSAVTRILFKSIVIPFYRSHAGLLIFVFLIMFGTVESNQLVNYHRSLIAGMFTSEIFLFCVCLVWILFSLKILVYILSLLRKSEYGFLNNLMLVPKSKAFVHILITVMFCFLPVLIYSVFIYLLGVSNHHYVSSLGLFLFQLLLCCINAYVILLFLRTQHIFSWTLIKARIPNISGRIGFYISHILNEEKIALLISKGSSLVLLYIVREASETGDDFRILGLTWVFVLLAHTFLVLKVKMFEDRYLTWIKSLPITTFKTWLLYFTLYIGLLLPELVFSITMIGNVSEVLMLALLSSGLLMFIHTYLLKSNRDPDQYSIFLFWLFVVSFFVILCNLTWVLAAGLSLASYLLLAKRYYNYEPTVENS